ncbi:hypothetical protein ACFW04_014108 [Cataglyphis niger]
MSHSYALRRTTDLREVRERERRTGAFPIDHPDIYVDDEYSTLIGLAPNYNFDRFEGFIWYKILPPGNLFHPVLSYRVKGKLLFALCRSCCERFSQTSCTHENASEHEFKGTSMSCELRKALEKDYLVTGVSEIWQYNVNQFDCATRQGGLFAEYINTFLKLKQEVNEVMRTPQRFMTLLMSAEHKITDILLVNDEVVYVSWRLRQDAIVPSPLINVVIAAYTTQARLKLYSYLERLDHRVLYYDTDSCIYKNSDNPHEYEPSTGNFLGDMTDELESYSRGSYIEVFVFGGPKFYAYVVRPTIERMNIVKGITLNYENSQLVNFSIKNLLITKEKCGKTKLTKK